MKEIVPNSAAAKAGLEKGDVILEVDGTPIPHAFGLRFEVGRRRSGDKVKLKVSRDGKEIELETVLDKRPQGETGGEKIPVPLPGPGGKTPVPPPGEGGSEPKEQG